jgi:hypothetical protein
MVSMKQEPEREEMPGEVEMDEPMYPEGMCLELEADDLEKLGITAMPKIGGVMEIRARAYVKSAAVEQTQGGAEPKVELQVTDMEIRGVDMMREAATMLYGSQGA